MLLVKGVWVCCKGLLGSLHQADHAPESRRSVDGYVFVVHAKFCSAWRGGFHAM